MAVLLGCIADDFTGGTDLAGMLVKHGMRTLQVIGVPSSPLPADVDAVVIALKSRTSPPQEAVADSLEALRYPRQAGCRQFYFKYCSTFDSTPRGNIGPVADALLDALGASFTIAGPALPANGRTIYNGHLFVGNTLLSESGMRDHPLTPMRDSNLVRLLQAQTSRKVGLVEHSVVRQATEAIICRIDELRRAGFGYAISDAAADAELRSIGKACASLPLVTGGSGIVQGLPANFPEVESGRTCADFPPAAREGYCAVIAGSCSVATNEQVHVMRARHPAFRVGALQIARGEDVVGEALAWARDHLRQGPVLIYASAPPEEISAVQKALGVEKAGALVEAALAQVAAGMVELGTDRIIVAGGETSGAVVKALGVDGLLIGPEIDPGVPWTYAMGTKKPLHLALKSGNFGTADFFLKAWEALP